MTEEQLSALLRLKRYEQPPTEYFDGLLRDIHRRQRAELLHRPLWRIALDRMQTLFSEHSMGSLSYAGAMAAVLVVGVGAIGLMTPGGQIVKQDPPEPVRDSIFTLQETAPAPKLDTRSLASAQSTLPPVLPQPHFAIDARPVSYESPSSFNF
jgi:hypothetical protein